MDMFLKSQFKYCPVVWMFYSHSLNNKINKLHERCLRITYNDKNSNFEELFVKDNFLSIHHRNIQMLAIEICKFANGISPEIMSKIFKLREIINHYNLRHLLQFTVLPVLCVDNGTDSAQYLGPKIWDMIPSKIKNLGSCSL